MNINVKKAAAGLVIVALLVFVGREILLISKASDVLAAAIDFSKKCDAGDKTYCAVAVSTTRNLEAQLRFIPTSQESHFVDEKSLAQLRDEILPRIEPKAQRYYQERDAKHQALTSRLKGVIASLDELQKAQEQDLENLKRQYTQLAAPKLLYKCGDSVTLIAGSGVQNYNDIFERASTNCRSAGSELVILSSDK